MKINLFLFRFQGVTVISQLLSLIERVLFWDGKRNEGKAV